MDINVRTKRDKNSKFCHDGYFFIYLIASPPINLGSFGDVKGRTVKLVYILTLSPNVEKIIVSVSTVTTATPLELKY